MPSHGRQFGCKHNKGLVAKGSQTPFATSPLFNRVKKTPSLFHAPTLAGHEFRPRFGKRDDHRIGRFATAVAHALFLGRKLPVIGTV